MFVKDQTKLSKHTFMAKFISEVQFRFLLIPGPNQKITGLILNLPLLIYSKDIPILAHERPMPIGSQAKLSSIRFQEIVSLVTIVTEVKSVKFDIFNWPRHQSHISRSFFSSSAPGLIWPSKQTWLDTVIPETKERQRMNREGNLSLNSYRYSIKCNLPLESFAFELFEPLQSFSLLS